MKMNEQDTPPSSVNGDEVVGMEDEGIFYLVDEQPLEDEMDESRYDDDDLQPEDDSILVFRKHIGSVFCCDLHPSGKVAVTGGEDDKAYIWSVVTGNVLMETTGHADSVIFAGFSFDGAFVATVDMSGIIKVWRCNLENEDAWPLVFEYETDDITWAFWHFGARVLICGTIPGTIYIFKIPSGNTKVLQGHNSRVECGKLFPDGLRLAAGYNDGSVKIWDIKTKSIIHELRTNDDDLAITSLDVHTDNNLVCFISAEGKAVLITSNNGKIVGQLNTEEDLEAVAFAEDSELGYIALGTLRGAVSIWDVSKQMIRHQCAKAIQELVNGVTKMFWVKNYLITSCLDGCLRIYEGRSGKENQLLSGHISEILDVSYNASENLILTAADDGTARIFKFEPKKDND